MKTIKRKSKTLKSKTKKQFLYNPNNPKKSFDVYIDKNPKDTIHIKYTTLLDVKNTWVYIRVEDFLVFFVLISWLILLFKKKINSYF